MGFIISWFGARAVELIADIYSHLQASILTIFSNQFLLGILSVVEILAWVLFGIAVVMRVSILAEQSARGQADILAFGKDVFLGLIFIPLNAMVMIGIFTQVTHLQTSVVRQISGGIQVDITTLFTTSDPVIQFAVLIIFTIATISLAWGSLARSATVFMYTVCNYCAIIGITMGNPTFFVTVAGKFAGVCFIHFFQGVFYFAAIVSLQQNLSGGLATLNDISVLMTPLIYIVFSISSPKVIEMLFANAVGGRGGLAGGMMQTMMMLRFATMRR